MIEVNDITAEIGIEIEAVELLFARALPKTRQIEICLRARAIGQPQPCSVEIRSAGWFSIDDLPPELSKDQRRLIQRTVAASENSNQ